MGGFKFSLQNYYMKLLTLIFAFACFLAKGQTYDAAYVKQLYAKYPTIKSELCPACRLWDNNIYRSIADTVAHFPLCEYYCYTKAHEQAQIAAKIPRTGIYAAWHPVTGQPDMQAVYTAANKQLKVEMAKGHVVAWITAAYSKDAAILSDTYDFNCAIEYQGQNVGTEIATENYTRKLALKYDTIEIWGGCFAGDKPMTVTANGITATIPSDYWKIIKYNGKYECWFLPNLPTETQAMIPKRTIALKDLILILGFDPQQILN